MSKFYTYTSVKGVPLGGSSGSGVQKVADAAERLALTPAHGDLVVQLDNNTLYEYDGATWIVIGPGGGGGVSNAIDTDSIDITIAGSDISADLKLSSDLADPGFQLATVSIETDGLKVQIPEFPTTGESEIITVMNNSGVTISQFYPVSMDSNGEAILTDVSNGTARTVVGVAVANIDDGDQGQVVLSGKFENFSTLAPLGSELFISKTGELTDTVPDIGVGGFLAGDYVISVGKVMKNLTNPLNKDLIINIDLRGQL